MDSNFIIRIHSISVMLFLLTYVIKAILLFTSRTKLDKYSAVTKVPEMIISVLFLISGIWLFTIIGGIKTMHFVKLAFVLISIPLAIVGFKKHKKGLALLSVILIIGAYGIAEMSRTKTFIPSKGEVPAGTDNLLANGALIYQQNCAFCHGADGKKMYRNAPDLTKSSMPADLIQQMILEGSKGKMPSYKLIITDENISEVAKYVESLKSSVNTTP